MTADVTVLRPVLPMTTFLTGNDVPREFQTRACAAFALWLEQLGDGNAPLALLHMAEALKAEQAKTALVEVLSGEIVRAIDQEWLKHQQTIGADEEHEARLTGALHGLSVARLIVQSAFRAALSGGVV